MQPIVYLFFEGFNGSATYARVLFRQGDTTLAGHFAYWRTIALSLQTVKTRKYFSHHILYGLYYKTRVLKVLGLEMLVFCFVKALRRHRGMNTRGENRLLWKGLSVYHFICVLCHNFWTNCDLGLFNTSKWLSELQFC